MGGRAPGGRAFGPPRPRLASRGEATLRSRRGNWAGVHREGAPLAPRAPGSLRVAKPRCARMRWRGGGLGGRAPGGRAFGPPRPRLASRGEATLRSHAVEGRGNWAGVHREGAPLAPRAPGSLRVAKPRCARMRWRGGGIGRACTGRARLWRPAPPARFAWRSHAALACGGGAGDWAGVHRSRLWPPAPRLASRGEATLRSLRWRCGGIGGACTVRAFGPPRPRLASRGEATLRSLRWRCGGIGGACTVRAFGPRRPRLASRGEATLRSHAVEGRGNWAGVHREGAPLAPRARGIGGVRGQAAARSCLSLSRTASAWPADFTRAQ